MIWQEDWESTVLYLLSNRATEQLQNKLFSNEIQTLNYIGGSTSIWAPNRLIKFSRCFPSLETNLGNLMFSKSFQAWKMHGIHFVFQPKIHDVFDEFLQKEYLTNEYIM